MLKEEQANEEKKEEGGRSTQRENYKGGVVTSFTSHQNITYDLLFLLLLSLISSIKKESVERRELIDCLITLVQGQRLNTRELPIKLKKQ